jgi:hypothetical protein
MIVLDGNFVVVCEPGTDCHWTRIFKIKLEPTDAIMNEVLKPITFVLAYPTVPVKLAEYSVECNTKEQS